MRAWMRAFRRLTRDRKAVSGLETAIVLIASVIVASALGYAILNMGLLATQKSQEVAMGGLQAASAAMTLEGPVYGYSNQTGLSANMTSIMFWLKTASGADSMDLNHGKLTIGFENPRGLWANIYIQAGSASFTLGSRTYVAYWNAVSITWEIGSGMLLDRNERVRVTIDTGYLTMADNTYAGWVQRHEQFKVIMKPSVGSPLTIVRYAPAEVKAVNDIG